MSNRLPLFYSNVLQADRESLLALDALLKLNDELSKEKQRLINASAAVSASLAARRTPAFTPIVPATMGSHIIGPSQQQLLTRSPIQKVVTGSALRSSNVTPSAPSTSAAAELNRLLYPNLSSTTTAAVVAASGIGSLLIPRDSFQVHPNAATSTEVLNSRLLNPRFASSQLSANHIVPIASGGPSPPPPPPSQGTTTAPSPSPNNTNKNAYSGSSCLSPPSKRVAPAVDAAGTRTEDLNNVRTEKVQAALLSQHQRGRKRDLNDMERMELTRTRNREHAKSTRFRKKARYEELLRCEEQLKQLLKSKDLQKDRVNCLQRFLSARQDMLNDDTTSATASSTKTSDDGDRDCDRSLKSVIVDPIENFRFLFEGPTSIDCNDGDAATSDVPISSISRMHSWDEQLRLRVSQQQASKLEKALVVDVSSSSSATTTITSSSSSFVYEIDDGIDGIAISNSGSGYARVDLVLYKTTETHSSSSSSSSQCGLDSSSTTATKTDPLASAVRGESRSSTTTCTRQKIILLAGMLKVQFDMASNRVSSATWTTLNDYFSLRRSSLSLSSSSSNSVIAADAASVATAAKGNDDNRNEGDEYPSVVSLTDHHRHQHHYTHSPPMAMITTPRVLTVVPVWTLSMHSK